MHSYRQALAQVERDARGVDGLRSLARCAQLVAAFAFAMRDSVEKQARSPLLMSLGKVVMKIADDHAARGAKYSLHCQNDLRVVFPLGRSRKASGRKSPKDGEK